MARNTDQLVANTPAPAVKFATTEAANAVLGGLYQTYTLAADAVRDSETHAQRISQEIAQRQAQINQLNAENEHANVEKQSALGRAQVNRDIAKGASDALTVLGSPIPSEQADVLRDGNWARVEQLHDELDRGGHS